METKQSITRREFEDGRLFYYLSEPWGGNFFYSGGSLFTGSGGHFANTRNITDEGFDFYTTVFDRGVDGTVKFEHCIKPSYRTL